MSYVKHLVSKKKRRFMEDGFDLDLAYIKPNIVAMGFPSENLEGVYRNNLDDVIKFLELKHKDKYKVYNLCSEKTYDPAKFGYRVSVFGFDDHNAPPFGLMLPCCKDLDRWLNGHSQNVAIVHCKAGKGRTGVMICAYLLYKNHFTSALESMLYYAQARTENDKGVTIPSQRRYVTYFGYYVRDNFKYVPKTVLLNSIKFVGMPNFNSGSCNPSIIIYQTKVVLHKYKQEVHKNDSEIEMNFANSPVPICGDIKIDVFHKDFMKKERMLVFWFNTHFLELGVTLHRPDGGGVEDLGEDENGNRKVMYEIPKLALDKANHDKKHKLFPENFKVRLNITIPRSNDTTIPPSNDTTIPRSNDTTIPRSNDTTSPQHDRSIEGDRTDAIREGDKTSRKNGNRSALPNNTSNPFTNDIIKASSNATYSLDPHVGSDLSNSRKKDPPRSPQCDRPFTPNTRGISLSMEVLHLGEEALSSDDEEEELYL